MWLGHGHLGRRGNDHEIWASPREIAVEMAWVAAWSKAVNQGRVAARNIQDEGPQETPNQMRAVPNARAAKAIIHPSLVGLMTAARLTKRLAVQAGQRYSKIFDSGTTTEVSPPQTPKTTSRSQRLNLAILPQTDRVVVSPITSPGSQQNRYSFPKFSPESPSNSNRFSFSRVDPGAPNHQRTRSENAATSVLRKHVVSRHSGHRRHSDLGFLDAFKDTVRERKHREKKEDAQAQAIKAMSMMLNEAKPTQEQLNKQADEAWQRTKRLSSNLEYNLNQLAEREWQKISEGRGLIASPFLPVDPTLWKKGFIESWERAWKESWAAAWQAVWEQGWHAAVARGVEFGVEEVLDLSQNASRINYRQLQSTESYLKVKEIIKQKDLNQTRRLEHVHSMMKELYFLYESLRHSISAIRDDCLEITVFTGRKVRTYPFYCMTEPQPSDKNKGISIAGGAGGDSERITYVQLQKWIEDEYISKKFQVDPELEDPLKRLFIRGIGEVWESASNVYETRNSTPKDAER